ncbi:MAG: phosphoserine transaminase [Alphaproteobacteria bacterium]
MTTAAVSVDKPILKPHNPQFSSGPCTKRPGWSVTNLENAWLGRSHRAGGGKGKLASVINKSKDLLGLPDDWVVGIVPASDTGAMEIAMWSLLGQRGVDVFCWESFGKDWATDVKSQLKLDDLKVYDAEYGQLPDLSSAKIDRDIVFTWNGTTSGVRVENADWIPENRDGLVICDATSAAFAMELDYAKLDVVTWSWQKVLGGEAAHGMLALSPRAVERLETYAPDRPLPKIFRLTKNGKLNASIFEGATINTPSMLAVEDALDALNWANAIGGLDMLIERANRNYGVVEAWVEQNPAFAFLAGVPEQRSTTSVCLKVVEPNFLKLDEAAQQDVLNQIAKLLETENVAFDIKSYRTAPKGFRIWCGSTVEKSDVETMLPWISWALTQVMQSNNK